MTGGSIDHNRITLASHRALASRLASGQPWRTTALAEGDTLALPDVAIEVPIAEFYEDVDFTAQPAAPG